MYHNHHRRLSKKVINAILLALIVYGLGFSDSKTGYARGESISADQLNYQMLIKSPVANKFGFNELVLKAERDGSVMIFVGFKLATPFVPEHVLVSQDKINNQRAEIERIQEMILDELDGMIIRVKAKYEFIP